MRTATATVILQQRQQTARTPRTEEAISIDRLLWQAKLTSIKHNTNQSSVAATESVCLESSFNRLKGEKKNEKKRSRALEQQLEEEAAAAAAVANRGDIQPHNTTWTDPVFEN